MKSKALNKISIILIAALLIAALATTLCFIDGSGSAVPSANAAEALSVSSYRGTEGQVESYIDDAGQIVEPEKAEDGRGHFTKAQLAAQLNVGASAIKEITNGNDLYRYFNGEFSEEYAMLTQDVSLSYNIEKPGYDKVAVNSSNSTFSKYFDGNGYTVNLHGGVGTGNFSAEYLDKYDSFGAIYYQHTGYLCAINKGTIKNVTIEYTSSHTAINASTGVSGDYDGPMNVDTAYGLFSPDPNNCFGTAGIIAGLNGDGGLIDNIKLNLNDAFKYIAWRGKGSSKHGSHRYAENATAAGGIAGRAGDGSVISNSLVNISERAGVYAGTRGIAGWATDDKSGLAMAGGFVGKMDAGTASITYCALTGSGAVKAFVNRADEAKHFRAYAGGITGGCVDITGAMDLDDVCATDSTTGKNVLRSGQINGILSSWTGMASCNYDNNEVKVAGQLFFSIGSGAAQSCVVLYNLAVLRNTPDETVTLDRFWGDNENKYGGTVKNFVSVYTVTIGGKITATFNRESSYDIRFEVIADGYDLDLSSVEMGNLQQKKYYAEEGSVGKIIWASDLKKGETVSSHISMKLDRPMYAEIYMLRSTAWGNYSYEFGNATTLAYKDTNGVVGDKFVREYTGQSGRLNVPEVQFTGASVVGQGSFADNWEIERDGAAISAESAYLPGKYKMRVAFDMGTNTYGYYNESERIVSWQPENDYVFTILSGTLNYRNADSILEDWQRSVTFEVYMPQAGDFDVIYYQRNGSFALDDPIYPYATDGSKAVYVATDNTGRNGTSYIFSAYKFERYTDAEGVEQVKETLVATSTKKNVKIDNETPEVFDRTYWVINDKGEKTQIFEDELSIWRKDVVQVEFYISDNNKSGIAATNALAEHELLADGTYKAVMTLEDSKSYDLTYRDNAGNVETVNVQANVDRVTPRLQFNGHNYRAVSGTKGYADRPVNVQYQPTFGTSGWEMWYSYSKDAAGNDVWVKRGEPMDPSLSGTKRTFVIDWNMGNVAKKEPAEFKMKMTNIAGIYDDVYISSSAIVDGVVDRFIISLVEANFYINQTLEALIEKNLGKTVSQLLKEAEGREKYFDKAYDGTDNYINTNADGLLYEFYANLEADSVKVVYSEIYRDTQPTLTASQAKITLSYATSAVGETKLIFTATVEGSARYKYDIFFADFSRISDFGTQDRVVYIADIPQGAAVNDYPLDVRINKRREKVSLSEDQLASSYRYGDEIPMSIDIQVVTGDIVTINLSGVKRGDPIGSYVVKGVASSLENIEVVVENKPVQIVKRPVYIEYLFDGKENMPSTVTTSSGRHVVTGSYIDVMTGEEKEAIIKTYLGENPVDAIQNIGQYRCVASIEDLNYSVLGDNVLYFTVNKGFLNLTTGAVTLDYTGNNVSYVPKAPQGTEGMFEAEEIKYTYYKYKDGARYDEASQTVIGTYDVNSPTQDTSDVGYYYVTVKFDGNKNFFTQEYPDGYLIVTNATTEFVVDNIELSHSFDGALYTFDLNAAKAAVRATSNDNLLWSSSQGAADNVIVNYFDSDAREYQPVGSIEQGNGWYSEVGSYSYKIEFKGDKYYKDCEILVTMIITKAVFKNVKFTGKESVVYNAKNQIGAITETIPREYGAANREYRYGARTYKELDEINIVNVGTHLIKLILSMSGYEDLEMTASVVISSAKIDNITVNQVTGVDYDGRDHRISFQGLEYRGGTYHYIDKNGEDKVALVTGMLTAKDAGAHSGKVTIKIANYEELVLDTYFEINKAKIVTKDPYINIDAKMPSGLSVANGKGYYTDTNGKLVTCALIFSKDGVDYELNEDGQLVYLDENGEYALLSADGVLPDGEYTVRMKTDSNHYMAEVWKIRIGQINSSKLTGAGIAAVVVAVAVMVAAVVTSIVIVKKRKAKGIV